MTCFLCDTQEQADLKLRAGQLKQKEEALLRERDSLEKLRQELDAEKDRLSAAALRLKTRAQEVESFSKVKHYSRSVWVSVWRWSCDTEAFLCHSWRPSALRRESERWERPDRWRPNIRHDYATSTRRWRDYDNRSTTYSRSLTHTHTHTHSLTHSSLTTTTVTKWL